MEVVGLDVFDLVRKRYTFSQTMDNPTSVRTPCAKEGCKRFKCEENNYCLKHKLCVIIDAAAAAGKKICSKNGCHVQIDLNYEYKQCDGCREAERVKDNAKRSAAAEVAAAQLAAGAPEKTCPTCRKVFPMEMFQGEKAGVLTKTCRPCRDDNKKQDALRDREHRNALARIASAKPEFKQKKRAYRDETHEKMVQYDLTSKARRLENLGPDGFLAYYAAQQAVWRAKNPEKYAAFNEKRRTNLHEFFNANYIRPSKNKNLEFTITEQDFASIAINPCFYCGTMEKIMVDGKMVERGFNGLDRMDQTRGYIWDNCVSACKMCNRMKKSLHIDVFLKRVEHMISFNFPSEVDAKLFPEVFTDHAGCSYRDYERKAENYGREFSLSRDQVHSLMHSACYLCAKCPTAYHKNGIDRFDSSIGYVIENCRPCCGECNYMKNNYVYQEFMLKLSTIYHHRILHDKRTVTYDQDLTNSFVEVTPVEFEVTSIMQRSQKKSKEEISENARIRQQQKRERLLNTLGSEEYRRKHAADVAANRRKKKEKNAVEESHD